MSERHFARVPAWRVEEFGALPSTQTSIKDRLASGEDVDGLVVRAAEQPAGRGRSDKTWASLPGGSYQSFAVLDRWDGALRRPSVTLILALHLAEELRSAGAAVTVKWPNDIYLGEGKLAGVLSEYSKRHLVVGIGLNVNNPVPTGASALKGWDVHYVNDLVLRAAHSALASAVRAVETDAAGSTLAERWSRLDHLAGRTVTVRAAEGTISGMALGVHTDGSLMVGTPTGTLGVHDGTVLKWTVPDQQMGDPERRL